MKQSLILISLLLLSLCHVAKGEDDEMSFLDLIYGLLGGSDSDLGECKGCFCIPENIDDPSSCPTSKPRTDYSDLIPIIRSFTWDNPYSLACDPYDDLVPCDTNPPLQEGGACVVEFSGPDGTCPDNWSFSIHTYEGTFEEAMLDASVIVTHKNPCGTCSSLQDLSVYLDKGGDLTETSTNCGLAGLGGNKEAGVQCFKDIGFTDGCAVAWYYNTRKTASECFAICGTSSMFDVPPNRPRDCELNRCLACDEEKAGPLFKKFAGRTRRNSGLLSHIARPCSAIVPLEHENPCTVRSIEDKPSGVRSENVRRLMLRLVWVAFFLGYST